MTNEPKYRQRAGYNGSFGEQSERDRKDVERYSVIAFLCLVVSIILISLKIWLVAGILVIFATSIGIVIVRKSLRLIRFGRESFDVASQVSEKKDDVITEFSHKIREPLNNLVIIGDLMLATPLQKKQKEFMETMIASTNNMVNTLNELTMQTAESLSFESRKSIKFNLFSTIESTIDLFSLKENSNIDFILSDDDLKNLEVIGDPITIKQIFLDLFNTIENEQHEGVTRVAINLRKARESERECLVSFRIQTDKEITLVDENDEARALSARLIASGKGIYTQEIKKGVTVFEFAIPFFNITPEIKKQIASPRIEELKQKDKTARELKDANILLVEDNSINQKITLLTLKPLVNSIDTAENGKEALDKFGTASYDLILMDIQMPVMSGLIAAEKIRALEASTNAHVPIIAITANAMLGDKERCLAAGMDDYISKPFQPSALIEKIKKFL
ncbi:MAG: response regulator [Bacteroidales bacterium]